MWDEIGGTTAPKAILHDLHTDPAPGEVAGVVAITLVEAREDSSTRNRPMQRILDEGTGGLVLKKPPLTLQLRYLMTPWSRDLGAAHQNDQEERLLEHKMLGRVAQVLYEDAILSGSKLKGTGDGPSNLANGLEGSSESLKVTLAPLTFEEQTRFWHAVGRPYRPSLTYDIRVLKVESEDETPATRVSSRELRYKRLTTS